MSTSTRRAPAADCPTWSGDLLRAASFCAAAWARRVLVSTSRDEPLRFEFTPGFLIRPMRLERALSLFFETLALVIWLPDVEPPPPPPLVKVTDPRPLSWRPSPSDGSN